MKKLLPTVLSVLFSIAAFAGQRTALERYALEDMPAPVYYFAASPIEEGSDSELAVIYIHGWNGGLSEPKQLSILGGSFADSYILAPCFPTRMAFERKGLEADGRALWNGSWSKDLSVPGSPEDDWRGGGDAAGYEFSSFDVIDKLLAQFSSRKLYPNLRRVVLCGFSAGGQFVSRYVAVGKAKTRRGLTVEYAAMSPSTELIPDPEVGWLYGLADRPRYASRLSQRKIFRNLRSRRVWWGCGDCDTTRGGLDVTPAAMAQGANRYERYLNFRKAVSGYPRWASKLTFHTFRGLGHNSVSAFNDPHLLGFIGGYGSLRACIGVLSDIHVKGEGCENLETFENALMWFRNMDADGVLITGDLVDRCHSANMIEVEKVWDKVFPENVGLYGRKVEKLFITGNHDFRDYGTSSYESKEEAWKKYYGLDWAPISIRDVNGYKFVLANYDNKENIPGLREFIEDHKEELAGDKPFFYAQHAHPKGTCSGPEVQGQDDGSSTEILGDFPNCVAISGHSHTSLTDERTIWQGDFTSVGAGSMYWTWMFRGRENSRNYPRKTVNDSRMKPVETYDGKQGMLMLVYDNAIVFKRREFKYGEVLGPDWVLPLPLLKDGPVMDFDSRALRAAAPEFAEDAAVSVSEFEMGKNRREEDELQQTVAFPAVGSAVSGSRAYDYEVVVEIRDSTETRQYLTKRVFSKGFHLSEKMDTAAVECVFADFEIPDGSLYRYSVRPAGCFGNQGSPLTSDWLSK